MLIDPHRPFALNQSVIHDQLCRLAALPLGIATTAKALTVAFVVCLIRSFKYILTLLG